MKILLLFTFCLLGAKGYTQDTAYARRIIDTLTSEYFFGRGYTKNGLCKAEKFLKQEYALIGLKPMEGKDYVQSFSLPVNTFPYEMFVELNGRVLQPGKDYLIGAESRKLTGRFELFRSDSATFLARSTALKIVLKDKLTWRVSKSVGDTTEIQVLKSSMLAEPSIIQLNVKNRYIKKFKTGNVCGFVKGTQFPDSFIFITAHYDHLGGMGENAFFPGANDNASGISLLLNLARWYVQYPLEYSIAFICFSGEEAGLVGSEYFVNHPLVPLKNIRFLLNLDLTGTGEEGITVVNATEFKNEFARLQSINDANNYFTVINSRGKAKNSDHYWFSEYGTPSFFIYTLGGIKAYHDIYDVSQTLPNNYHTELFSLLKKFISQITGKSATNGE